MARGKKKSIDDLIAEKDDAITKLEERYKSKIAGLKAERKKLIDQKEYEAKEKIVSIIADSGLSADELRELIEQHKKSM